MSKNVGVFVDVANLYYAAKSAGVDVDYVTLLKGAVKGRDLIRAYAYSGLDPENENQRKFIDFLSKNGYKVVHKDIRKYGDGKIKANLDIELVVDLFRLADRMDVAVVVSGDGDFAPAIRALQDKGVRGEVISFRGNTSSDLIAVADEFIDIMKIVEVGRTKKDAVAPAMPAKEVTPEFSFREAPASVAAAARAALRTGRSRPATARRGEPPAVTAAAIGSEAEVRAAQGEIPFDEAELVPTAGEPPEGRTRRRRRGGRGRGRADGELGARETGWEEFDSLSEIEDMAEVPDYSFREADDVTLAELGLTAPGLAAGLAVPATSTDAGDGTADLSGGTDADGAESPRKRTRRGRRGGRGRKRTDQNGDAVADDSPAGATDAGDGTGEPIAAVASDPTDADAAPPPRRAPRARRPRAEAARADAAAEPAVSPVALETTEQAPRARRSRRPAAADASAGEATEPAPRARRTRKPAAAAENGETTDPAGTEGAPRRRASGSRTRRTAGGSDAAADPTGGEASRASASASASGSDQGPNGASGDQPRGIWQRLLSGRRE